MPSSDYASVSRGCLKIKGVQGSKISKSGKKKKKPKDNQAQAEATSTITTDQDAEPKKPQSTQPGEDAAAEGNDPLAEALANEDSQPPSKDNSEKPGKHMTDTERQAYERRYKLLEDRLKREGVKSHKERVESLNRYLSNLSEHHDMPKIGPG